MAQEVRLTADTACDLTFRALVDVDGVQGRMLRRRTDTPGEPEPACDGSLLWETEGGLGRCGVALLTEGPDGAQRQLMAHPPEKERDSGAPVKPLKALIEGVAREYVHRSMMQIDVSSPEPQLCLRCAGSGIVDTGVCHMCDRSGKAQIDTDLSAAAEQESAPRSQPNSSARLATQR